MKLNKLFKERVLHIKEISHITDVKSYVSIKESNILKTRSSSMKVANHKNSSYKKQYLNSTNFLFEDLLFEFILVNNKINHNIVSIDEDWVFSYFFEKNNKFILNKKSIIDNIKRIKCEYATNKYLQIGLLLLLEKLKINKYPQVIKKGSNKYKKIIDFFYSNKCSNIRKIIFCGFNNSPPSITIKGDIVLDNLVVHQKIHFLLNNEQSKGFPVGFDEVKNK